MRKAAFLAVLVILSLSFGPVSPAFGGDAAMKPEELVAKHLDSIGTAEVRAAAKTRTVQGAASFRILVGGSGKTEGTTGMVSEGNKVRLIMRFPQRDYRGENFLFNGDALQLSFANSNQSRSPLSGFLSSEDVILRDGLLGGALSTAWPLLNLEDRKAKLVYEGLKKVDGHQVHVVRYQPKKTYEAQIRLYFDAETFRHVKTVYTVSLANNLGTDTPSTPNPQPDRMTTSSGNSVGGDITQSAKLQPQRSTLEERFSDFKTVDGLNLPTHWNIQFTRELPNGSTTVTEWDLHEDQITNNQGLDPRNFEVK